MRASARHPSVSISSFQEKFLNKGCGTAIIVVSALALGISMLSSQCARGNMINGSASAQDAVVTVGDVPVTAQQIQAAADSGSNPDGGALDRASQLASATYRVVNSAGAASLVLQSGEPAESEVETVVSNAIEDQLDQQREMMVALKQPKANATPAEIDQALTAYLGGQTPSAYKKDQVTKIVEAYKDPQRKGNVLQAIASRILASRAAAKSAMSDEALRNSYKTLVFKRVFLSDASGSKESAQARAQKVLDGLKSGKSFDAMMDQYSNDPASPGKKVHDLEEDVPATQAGARPEFAEIKDKPVGAVSGIVDVPGGKAVYRLAATRNSAPADFEKNKDKYRRTAAMAAASTEVEKKVKDYVAAKSSWSSKAFEAMFLQGQTTQQSPTEQKAALEKAFDLAQQALKSDQPGEVRVGAMAALLAEGGLYNAPDADKAKLADQRIGVLEAAFANGLDDGQLRMELVDLYAQKKNGAKATEALVAASKGNLKYDATGQKLFSDIAGKALTLQQQGVITADQLKTIQAQQVVWSDARAAYDKAMAESKKQEEAAQKANEAEIARQKAEAAKAGGTAPATPGTGIVPSPGTTPPTSTAGGGSKLFGGATSSDTASGAPAAGGKK